MVLLLCQISGLPTYQVQSDGWEDLELSWYSHYQACSLGVAWEWMFTWWYLTDRRCGSVLVLWQTLIW